MYTYASRIAYFLFKKDRPFLSAREMADVHDEYCRDYDMNLPHSKIRDLVKARILCKDGDFYRFTYKGLYCYFVARYFSENIGLNKSEHRCRTEQCN